MSTTVDSKVVEMRFDNKQFESNVQTSLNTLEKLEKSLDLSESAKGLDSISKAADRVSFDGLGSGIENVKMKFSALDVAVATVFQNITQKALSLGSKLVTSLTNTMRAGFSEYETQINAVQTILANTQNTTKQVVKQTSQESIAASQETLNKAIANNDAALKSLQKTHKEELKSYQKLADDELDTLDEKYEEELDALEAAKKEELKLHEKYAEEELEALEDAQEQELEELENAYDQEMALMKQVHEQKLKLYDQEYMEKLKVVDEERYYKIKAIDDEINAINQLTQQEEEQLEQQKQMAKLNELQDKVNNAETDEDRLEAEQKLNEYIQELSRKQLLKERKSRIEQLKLEKESINEEYDEIEKQLKEEYEAKKKEENEVYNLVIDNLKKEKSEKVAALKEIHKEQREMRKEELELEKEAIKEKYEEETKSSKKAHEEEKKNIKERLELEKEAIQERQDAEIDALKAKHAMAISNLQAQQAAATQIETVAVTPSTIEDVNRALDDLNEYADKTIYNFTEMTRNIGTFTAAGIDLDTSVSAIKGIANLAAVSGSTSQQASTAMYQLSQALAAGTVKLMDWNSVVNAGMGGQVFQEALKRTAKVMGTDVDALIAKYGSFRESLTTGWITSDVLTETLRQFTLSAEEGSEQWEEFKNSLKEQGYTEEQAIEILKMGNTATDAATKVKTLTQLFDTLGEAKQSGWTQTWRIIIGDFEEAKEFLTEISDIFGEMINQSAEARNNMLQGWKDLGGRTALLDALRNAFYGVMSIVTPIKEAFREIFPPTTSKQLYDLTVKIRDLTAKLKLNDEQSANLKTTFKGLFSILSLGKQAVTSIFKTVKSLSTGVGNLGGSILSVTAKIGDWLTKISEAAKKSDIFTKALNILISPVKLLKDLIAGITKSDSIQTFFIKAKESLNGFFTTITENIGPATESFDDFQATVKEKFDAAVASISSFGKTVKDKLNSAIESIKSFMELVKEKIDFKGFESFNGFLAGMSDKMSGVKAATADMKDTVVSAVDSMDDKASKSPILQFFKNMWDGIKTIASAIGGVVGKIGSKVGDVLTDPALVDLIKGVSVGAIALTLSKFLKSISGFFDRITESVKSFTNITENIKGVLDGVKDCLKAYQNDLNANALMKLSKAILIMAAALVVLSFVNAEKLNGAIVAMSSLFAGLVVSMKTFSKNSGSIAKASAACVAMAVAVAILSGSLVALSTVSPDSLNSAIINIGVLIAMLTAFSKAMAKANGDIGKGATTLIAFAIAIKIIASTCKDLSDDNIKQGLFGTAVLIAMLTYFSKTLSKGKGDIGKGATTIIAFGIAIKILAGVCKDLSTLSWEQMAKGLVGVGVLLFSIMEFVNHLKNSKNLTSVGIGLITIATSMKIFGSAVKQIGSIDDKTLAKGLGSVIGLLAAFTLAFIAIPSDAKVISTAASFMILSTALVVLAGALRIMGGMSQEQALIGLGVLAGSLAALTISLSLMKGTLEGSAALLIAIGALTLLIPILTTLGILPLNVIGTGLLAIAGAFVVLGLAGALLGPIAPAIMSLAGSFALLGAGIAAIGLGLSLITAGLVALATLGSAGAIVIAGAIGIIVGAIGLAIVVIAQKLGEAVVAFANTIRDGSQSICEAVSAVIQAVIQALVESIPPLVEGVLIILEEVLDSLDEHLPSILEKILNLVLDVLDMLIEYTPKIVAKVMEILLEAGRTITEYIPEIVQLGVDMVLGLVEGLNSRMDDIIQAAFDLIINFINGISKALDENSETLAEAIVNLFVSLIKAAADLIGGAWELLKKAWDALMESGIFQAIRDKFNSIKETIWEFILKAKEAIEEKFEDFKNAGKDLIGGFIQGIKDKALALYNAAKEVVSSAVEGVKNFLGINSPSKLFKQIGIYSDQGLIEGLEAYSGKVDDAAENVGSNMLDAMANSIRNISDILDDEDWQPTIRPVMDLSNVEKGARSIDAMFSKTQAMELGARMSARSSDAAQIQNGVNSKLGNTYTFTQNNYSPKALSRIDIYRQTKNQFSAMERMVTT